MTPKKLLWREKANQGGDDSSAGSGSQEPGRVQMHNLENVVGMVLIVRLARHRLSGRLEGYRCQPERASGCTLLRLVGETELRQYAD